jgi:hypothetical protein
VERPDHLAPEEPWLARRKAAAAAVMLGALSFLVVAVAAGGVGSTPDWRISVPGFALTALAALGSIARREPGAYPLWLAGLGLAGVSLVLGWFLLVAIVIAGTVLVILILHALM